VSASRIASVAIAVNDAFTEHRISITALTPTISSVPMVTRSHRFSYHDNVIAALDDAAKSYHGISNRTSFPILHNSLIRSHHALSFHPFLQPAPLHHTFPFVLPKDIKLCR
jgi:hypothetical protein